MGLASSDAVTKSGIWAEMVRVFMDESGVHDAAPAVTVSAYVGSDQQWAKFRELWTQRKRPIKVFHAGDCNGLRGEFAGWDRGAANELSARLLPILSECGVVGIITGLDRVAHSRAVASHPEIADMLGQPYGACFHWTMQVVREMMRDFNYSGPIQFVHEVNSYKTEAKATFDEIWADKLANPNEVTLEFGTKDQFVELQAADAIAYEAFKFIQRPTRDWSKVRASLRAIDPTQKMIRFLAYDEGSMPALVAKLLEINSRQCR